MSKIHKDLKKYLREPRIKKIYDRARREFGKNGPIAHNWDHVYRDLLNAIWIGEAEGADMSIVVPAIILHDIGFLYDSRKEKHAEIGAKKVYEWLNKKEWTKEEQDHISDCIATHKGKYKQGGEDPQTLEAKVVYDADLLEKVGMIGVMQGLRSFVEFAETGESEFRSLLNIARYLGVPRTLNFFTKTAREIARDRAGHAHEDIFKQAVKELEEYE